MKNVSDFKNIRLSKKQMGNITGGKMFRCYIYESGGSGGRWMYLNFDSSQDILDWYNSLPWGTRAECNPFQTWRDDTISDPYIDMPIYP